MIIHCLTRWAEAQRLPLVLGNRILFSSEQRCFHGRSVQGRCKLVLLFHLREARPRAVTIHLGLNTKTAYNNGPLGLQEVWFLAIFAVPNEFFHLLRFS